MLPAFFDYLRNITYYLVFMAAVGALAPSGKYKKFIVLIMGIMLIGAVIEPINRIIAREEVPLTNIFGGVVPDSNIEFGDHFKDAFHFNLTNQAEALLERNGFKLISAKWDTSDDMAYIRQIFIVAGEGDAVQNPERFIRIEPVRVAPYQPMLEPEETAEAKQIKKLLADFYDMDIANIHVEMVIN